MRKGFPLNAPTKVRIPRLRHEDDSELVPQVAVHSQLCVYRVTYAVYPVHKLFLPRKCAFSII